MKKIVIVYALLMAVAILVCNPGRTYDIVSTTSLVNPDWQPYNDGTTTYENIAADVFGTNSVTGVETVGPNRFFKILEK